MTIARAWYNEIYPFAAAWLRELIKNGLIAPGDVDERSVKDVQASDLTPYTQCHFFAGIAGWSLALRMAGWPDDAAIWTASCPCQPWSNANVWEGGGKGSNDDRHLWPDFYRLVRISRPASIIGEQVAGAIQRGWLDQVFDDFEASDYACASAVYPASAFGAEHERKRLYWLADASGKGWKRHQPIKRISVAAEKAQSLYGDPLAGARRALDGDYSDLLPCDGVSVVLERHAVKGYGNAIVPQAAAHFISAYLDVLAERGAA